MPLQPLKYLELMWTKPYGMKEGFLIGGCLIIAGLMFELSCGPIDWDAFRWPVNGITLAGFLALVAILFLLRKRVSVFQFIGTYKAAIPALVYAVVLTIVMGLTRQEVNGTWLSNMLSFWPFVLIYVYIAMILGQVVLLKAKRLVNLQNLSLTSHLSPLTSIVCIGISLITIGMLFGALWAKEAWGDYWSWDPKETWALITWFAYLVYVHYRQIPTHRPRRALWVLLISFVLLQMCWWGIKYLPAAQGSSIHVYSMPS